MRNLLGDLWNNYSEFVLAMTSLYITPETALTGSPYVLIYMRGLNFRNTYIQASNVPSGTVPLIYRQINGTSGLRFNAGEKETRCIPFIKQEANVKLEFDIYDYTTTLPLVNSTNPLPTFGFQFIIMPLK
jgi:hypothetical protein